MWFGILGHLAVRRADGTDVPVPGPARRQLLAALLCRPGAVVATATLVEDLWGSAPPRSAISTLRSHVVRLRAALADGGGQDLLVTERDGYRFAVRPGDVDAGRFEALIEEANGTADPQAALVRYDEALGLWREEPYVEFGDAPFAVLERIRLSELRALARERRSDLALAAGMANELVGELEQRVRTEPYRERGWEQLALALYRAGRQADALDACRRARTVLLEDLGVDPGPGLLRLEHRLLQQDPDLLSAPLQIPSPVLVLDRCPYLGLSGYDEDDAALFVGRERVTSVIAGRLADQSIVVVTGASGVGKSSIVRAGLVPALRAGALPGSPAWRVDVRTPSQAAALDPDRRPDLVVLDQAEELFTTLAPHARDDLMTGLARFVDDDGGRVVLVLRSDFYGRLAEVATLAPFAEKTAVLVGPMRADELRRALVEPASVAGLRLEDELVETILDDVAGQPEPLPLLSEAMVRTWQRREGQLLTLDGYRQAGELAGALEAAAEECYAGLDEAAQRAARQLLVRMATRAESGWLRRSLPRSDSQDDAEQRALAALIGARLVVADERRVEITHDALLGHWPRLRDWLEERSLAADLLEHLDQAAATWHAAGRQDSDLYRGARLAAALDWRLEHAEDLTLGETEFLETSAHAADAELEAERRGRRNLRRVVVALAAVVALALAGGVIALVERGHADSQARRAQRAALAADARRLAALSANAPDIATSSLLAVAGYRLQDSADTRGALLTAVERNESALWRMRFRDRPQLVSATPNGSRVVVSDNETRVFVIDPHKRKAVANFPTSGFDYGSHVVGITADGSQVVAYGPLNTGQPESELAAYDVSSGRKQVITDAGDPAQDAPDPAVTSDGRWVALIMNQRVGRGAVVDIWDSRDWKLPARHFVTAGAPVGIATGRSVVAVEHADGSVEVRALPSLRLVGRLPATAAPQPSPHPLAVSADGADIARVDPADPRRAVLYRLGPGSQPGISLPTTSQAISVMAFAPDGTELAVASESGSLAVYGADGSQLAGYAGHAGPLHGIAWTGTSAPTGLYTVGLDGDLVSWDLSSGPRTVQQSGPDQLPPAGQVGLSGPYVVDEAQPPDNPLHSARRISTFDVRTHTYSSWPAGLIDANGNTEGIAQVSASANGSYATANIQFIYGAPHAPNRVEIYDLRTHRAIGHLALPHGGDFPDGYYAAVSPDGRRAYCNCSPTKDEIDVFALPSGKYLTSFRVRFAGPDTDQVEPECWRFDPSGRLVVGGSSSDQTHQRVGLVDVARRKLVAQTDLGEVDPPTAIAWSHDGHTLALGGDDGAVGLYDAATLRPRSPHVPVTSGNVNTVSFAPDGKTVLVGGTDGILRFLNVADLAPLGQPLTLGAGPVWAWYDATGDVVGLAPDSRPGTDGYRWFHLTAAPAELARIACGLVGGDITRAEWKRYVGDRPYRHVCG